MGDKNGRIEAVIVFDETHGPETIAAVTRVYREVITPLLLERNAYREALRAVVAPSNPTAVDLYLAVRAAIALLEKRDV